MSFWSTHVFSVQLVSSLLEFLGPNILMNAVSVTNPAIYIIWLNVITSRGMPTMWWVTAKLRIAKTCEQMLSLQCRHMQTCQCCTRFLPAADLSPCQVVF